MSDQAERVPFDESAEQIKSALVTGRKTVYDITVLLGWTNGKAVRVINRMIQDGDVFAREEMRNGRGIKVLSLTPFEDRGIELDSSSMMKDLADVCSAQNEMIKKMIELKLEDLSMDLPPTVDTRVNIGKKIVRKIAIDLGIDLQEIVSKSQSFLGKGDKK